MLEENLLTAIKKVIEDNKAFLTNKTERAIKKSIKQIAKKTDKKKNSVSTKKNNEAGLNSDKIKTDAVTTVSP